MLCRHDIYGIVWVHYISDFLLSQYSMYLNCFTCTCCISCLFIIAQDIVLESLTIVFSYDMDVFGASNLFQVFICIYFFMHLVVFFSSSVIEKWL